MQFIDLKRQHDRIGDEIGRRMHAVMEHQKFIMGPEVAELEAALAEYTGRKYAFTCSSGTDALVIPLMAYELKETDAVFVPAFTFFASAESVSLAGGTPVFVDSAEDFNMDLQDLECKILKVLKEGKLTPRGIIAVDLFGQACDYDAIGKLAEKYHLFVIEDAAQSMGGSFKGSRNCAFGDVSATSFFPAKPLGCYGDGGAIFTDDDALAGLIASIRVHGKGSDKYDNVRIGMNGRLDTLQAAVLLPKLAILDDEIARRQEIAAFYKRELEGVFELPAVAEDRISAWAQFTLLADNEEQRDRIIEEMKGHEIPIMVYYSCPMHMQTAYRHLGYEPADLPRALDFSKRVFSVPMHPYLTEEEVITICRCLKDVK